MPHFLVDVNVNVLITHQVVVEASCATIAQRKALLGDVVKITVKQDRGEQSRDIFQLVGACDAKGNLLPLPTPEPVPRDIPDVKSTTPPQPALAPAPIIIPDDDPFEE
jgi:hypothetical protein